MLKDIAASSDAAAASLAQLHKLIPAPLYGAAQRLIDIGGVFDVRVLQGGRVVTGVAAGAPSLGIDQPRAQHRVYIQNHNRDGLALEGECSCGQRSPCVHVAAVMMVAAKSSSTSATHNRITTLDPLPRPQPQNARGGAPLQQRLDFLLEIPATAPPALGTTRSLQLSAWVTQTATAADGGRNQAVAWRSVPRTADGNRDYPRYVDADDRAILETLTAQHTDGPWDLRGVAGFDLLQRAASTGRAFWQSLQGRGLRAGAARQVRFAWEVLPNGDQHLRRESAMPLDLLLELEPAVCVDPATGEWSLLELEASYPVELLRRYWDGAAVAPEHVAAHLAALNEDMARDVRAAAFPRPRALSIQGEALSSLRAKLVLSADPEATATLHFVYNGMAIDSRTMRAERDTVRRMEGNIVCEIERDREAERRLRAQLDQVLAETPSDSAAWLGFMMKGVPALRAAGWEITTDAGFRYRIAAADDWYADLQRNRQPGAARPPRVATSPQEANHHHPHGASRSRAANQSREWFDLQLGVMVEGHAVNLLPALVRYLQSVPGQGTMGLSDESCLRVGDHLLVRLEDQRYLPVPMERIQRIADTLVELFDKEGLGERQSLTLPVSQAARLAQLALEPNAPVLRSDDPWLLKLIDAVQAFSGIRRLPAPAHFPATLRPYQQEGLGWLQFLRNAGLGGILADDMGLGKTVQTLAHLAIEKQQGRLHRPSLIVAPVSVLGNWQQEIRRFTPELTLVTLHGAKRKELFGAIERADVVLTGYPALLLDSEILLAREFHFVILDEAQTIKNPRAKVSQVARALRAEHRLCLTGTPMENHLGELWSLFDFVQPGLLGEQQEFQRHYRMPIENGGDTKRARALSRRIEPFLLRRTKDAVAQDLPPKIQIVEPIVLDERQRDFYDGIRLGQHRRVRDAIAHQGLARSHITVLDALLKLRQACCDPRLVNGQRPDNAPRLVNAQTEAPAIPSAKLDWLSATLPELIAEGRRILLFSQFTSMLRLIETAVTELSIPYCLLTGETQHRTALIDRFQAGAVPLFLISLKAGGTGLNLTAADTIIHYDPWWNPAAENQATDRAHRIGQDKPVFVYKLIAQGTVEEKIMQLQADKHALVNQLYSEKNASPASLSAADLEALFAP